MSAYHVENFGCRASQSDGDAIAATLEALGAAPAPGFSQADVVVVNTCTVTAEADRDARAFIRRVQRSQPKARIVVTGCYAQRAPQEIAALPGVFAVVGNSHKNQVASIAFDGLVPKTAPGCPILAAPVAARVGNENFDLQSPIAEAGGFVPLASLQTSAALQPLLLADDIFAHTDFSLPSLPASAIQRLTESPAAHRTRPSLKIQDGCGNRCTFCVIPSTRGNSRSLPRQQVLASVAQFVASGGQELVISGINLGRWGRDLVPQQRLEDLFAEILETTALPRLRISSVEPMDWTDGLVSLLHRWGQASHPRLARHVHMPLQSGSDRVLRRMHRRYRPWHYADRVARVLAACPDASIGADVMVGFPGETDDEFQETYDFLASLPLTYLHLFPFSPRPGTHGWELHRKNPVPAGAVRLRMSALRALIDQKNRDFRARFLGKTLSVVTLVTHEEETSAPGTHSQRTQAPRTAAMADNFLAVEIDACLPPNSLVPVQITGLTPHGLSATLAHQIRRLA